MSLRVASGGILETNVSWNDFECYLREALSTQARLGSDKSVVDIGEGNGFASRCGLISCDWIETEENDNLPNRLVLKVPSLLPLCKLNDSLPPEQRFFGTDEATWAAIEAKMKVVHNIEVEAYRFFEGFDGLVLPRMFYARRFGEERDGTGQLCIDYVDNTRMMNFHENHEVEVVKQIARALGKMQACSLKKELTAAELRKNWFAEFATSHTHESYVGQFRGIFTIDDSADTKKLIDKIEAILAAYVKSTLPSTICKQMGYRPVLVNGDLRTENVLIDKDSGDLSAIVDWQCTHLGVGVEDLHRITLFALSAEDRRVSLPMLIEEMHKSLVESLDGAEPPYSLKELLHLSDLLFPHCALYCTSGAIALIAGQDLDPKVPADEKATRKKVKLAKVIGALEDILALDAKNKEAAAKLTFREE